MNDMRGDKLAEYYAAAESWSADREKDADRSRRIAWIVAGIAVAVALLEAIALVLLIPLKREVPYTLLVDRQTGFVEALKRALILAWLLQSAAPLAAQISPTPSAEDARTQTIIYQDGLPIRLVAFPDASMTVLFHPGERIDRVVLSDSDAFRATVVGGRDTLELAPLAPRATAGMRVETSLRSYLFELETREGSGAAYLVRFVPGAPGPPSAMAPAGTDRRAYRLSGKRAVMPASVVDDGSKTFIEFAPDQSLPAVFGVGPTGNEEIVAGYMRGGIFVIDRVYPALVFQIDQARATAERQERRN